MAQPCPGHARRPLQSYSRGGMRWRGRGGGRGRQIGLYRRSTAEGARRATRACGAARREKQEWNSCQAARRDAMRCVALIFLSFLFISYSLPSHFSFSHPHSSPIRLPSADTSDPGPAWPRRRPRSSTSSSGPGSSPGSGKALGVLRGPQWARPGAQSEKDERETPPPRRPDGHVCARWRHETRAGGGMRGQEFLTSFFM